MESKVMTVLMFGWEFPPHISGGLGTACYGLTKSLIEDNTHILFVVPKAFGDEEIPLINASEVFLTELILNGKSTSSVLNGHEKKFVKISVPSTLMPYQAE